MDGARPAAPAALAASGPGAGAPPGAQLPPLPLGPFGARLLLVCQAAAVLGALVFTALVAMSIVSITGRKLWSAPVPGDVELLQMCSAFAASVFFAYCHLNGGDVKVDFFTDRLPAPLVHGLDAIGSLLVGLFGFLLAWRTGAGAWMVGQAGETSMIIGVPLWIGQALMVPGFLLLGVAGCYMAGRHAARARRWRRP
ncbi:TRAP transporter small permease [Ramlibacter sp.]|uniref:TRAP transporter small permease n=1 Tax=Ramlibacter sp. TaxID=1917967 RepID=UPI002C282A5C|nr:TRAP transporter small permease [Ramlibacter sp.]HWI84478.1 TRAP transporter small permease [Ramlibacter sp.]